MDSCLTFRPAKSSDVEEIWDLLHAQAMAWRKEKVLSNLNRLFILLQGHRLIGVLCAKDEGNDIDWTVVHPFCPEKIFTVLLTENYRSLFTLHSFTYSPAASPAT